ncbi:LD-carboxypeptidase [Mucilaginibacter roseus]|uniref:LD-carboxypeptidase n=1 Tax=Mucilaginibacter roseus TaxID=1528868 RepID=A0ABS8U6N8_9SPHI|nr:LD-carboxypeptidase [Mucilaginibacter roseus]MCD8741534.1 LD-carboxypeptidase [Mucilaginibacter roseus]
MSITPPYLKKGDKIAITCPAKKLPKPMTDAINLLQSWGLEVILGETVKASFHQFSGDDALRAKDMQRFVDDDSVKAIIAARGGYGTIRIIDHVNFDRLATNPKWVLGFSDITLLHSHLYGKYQLQSIHGQMPVNIPDASAQSTQTLYKALFGEPFIYEYTSPGHYNISGEATGTIVGGNLTLLVCSLGSVSDFDYTGKILFIEDVGEYLYSIDRLIRTLDRAGKLKNLAGLIVGGFTDLKDNDIPFGQTVEEIVLDVVKGYGYPACFDFPAGHIPNNHSIIHGAALHLVVDNQQVKANYI